MLNIVVSILFKLIAIVGSVIATPIILILKPVMSLFGFNEFIPYILGFIDTAMTYFEFFAISLHIPLAPLILVISLGAVIFTFTISMRAIIMIRSMWDMFKGSSGGNKIGFDISNK